MNLDDHPRTPMKDYHFSGCYMVKWLQKGPVFASHAVGGCEILQHQFGRLKATENHEDFAQLSSDDSDFATTVSPCQHE